MVVKGQLPSPPPHHEEFFEVVVNIKKLEEAAKFFRDLLSHGELEDLSRRIQIAKKLDKGKTYAKIAEELGVSTTTVGRVAAWYHRGEGGLKLILERHQQQGKEREKPPSN